MTDVFISYSRQDTAFARRLFDALKNQNRTPWIDWEGIPYSVDWWKEICRGIDGAETFILIISPASMTSMICSQEIEYARRSNKRIVPVVYQQPDEKALAGEWFGQSWEPVARDNWTAIKQVNWLFFRDEDDFDAAFANLIKTIEEHPEHVRAHTRLLVRAREWENGGHNRSFLLHGDDLRKAEQWLGMALDRPPAPVSLHVEYITASRRAERARQRSLLTGVSVALVVALILTILSLFLFQNANTERQRADDNAATSEANYEIAVTAEAVAREQTDRARSEALVAYSQTIAENDPELALKLALEANHFDHPSANARRQLGRLAFSLPVRRQMSGPGGIIEDVAFSADDRLVAAVSMGGGVRVWETNTGNQIAEFLTGGQGTSVTFSPDGRYLAVGRSAPGGAMYVVMEGAYEPGDFVVVVYDLTTLQEVDRLSGHTGSVNTVDYSPDGRFLLSGSGHRTLDSSYQDITDPERDSDEDEIILWDMTTGDLRRRFEGHTAFVTRVKFLPDGEHFLSAGADGQLLEWDIESGESRSLAQFQYIGDMALSGNSEQILLAARGGMVLLDRSGRTIQQFEFYGDAATLSADASRAFGSLVLGSNTIAVFDTSSGEQISQYTEHVGVVPGLAVSHDGRWLVSGSTDSLVIVRSLMAGEPQVVLGRHEGGIWEIAFTPDGRYLLSGASDNHVMMWDVEQHTLLHQFEGHTDWIDQIAISADGQWAASAGRDDRVAVWDIDPASAAFGEALYWLETGPASSGVVFLEDRTQIATLDTEGNIGIWDVTTGERTAAWSVDARTHDLAYRAHRLAVLSLLKIDLFALDPADPAGYSSLGEFPLRIGALGGTNGRLNMSMDGRQLAVAQGSFTAMSDAERAAVRLIDLETGDIRSFVGVTDTVWDVTLNADNSLIAAAYGNGTVVVWDTRSGIELQRLEGLSTQVKAVSFSPQSSLLALATDDIGPRPQETNQIILWTLYTPQELMDYVEQNFTLRDYTCAERLTYGVGDPCE
ncbi:MAG: TIR domain-containing protein [Chloroflexi bacterium]|nr:TIR domain-containing protein [Chloroflexota bacterium]